MTPCPTAGTGRTGPGHHCTDDRLQGWHTELPFQAQITLLAPSPPPFDSSFAVFFPQSTARCSSHAQQHERPMQESDPHPRGWGPAPALPLPTTQHLKNPLCKARLMQQAANAPSAQLCCQQDPDPLTAPCIGCHPTVSTPKWAEKLPQGQGDRQLTWGQS